MSNPCIEITAKFIGYQEGDSIIFTPCALQKLVEAGSVLRSLEQAAVAAGYIRKVYSFDPPSGEHRFQFYRA